MRAAWIAIMWVALLCLALLGDAQRGDAQLGGGELRAPDNATTGQPMVIRTGNESQAILYLVGPGQVIRQKLQPGSDVQIKGEEVRSAGRWVAILREGGRTRSQAFWVKPGEPAKLSFLARPSRVPVARPGVISGLAFVFDRYQNLILEPTAVKFSLSVQGSGASQSVTSRYGVAWVDSSSARKAGAAQFVASVGDLSVTRVVQQVASDPCNLRMHVAQRDLSGVTVETDPVRDCTGNPVPDGTIVTFIQMDHSGKSTVDARIKRGIARALLPNASDATVTVASGVVLGNEMKLGK